MLYLLAHTGTGGGYGDNPILTPWELHPILVHFPIAFLLGAVVLSAYASWRGRLDLERVATALFLAGVGTGLLAGAAGLLAFFTLPATHTELAHSLMYWHLGLMVGSLLLFIAVAWVRWRNWQALPGAGTQILMWLAAVVFVVGAALGGHIVYHGGTGIEGNLLRPGLHEEHHRGHGEEESPGHREDHSGHASAHESH
jgi:uncharacterized membrane protein